MHNLLDYLKKPIYCSGERPRVGSFLRLFLITLILVIPFSIVANFITKEFNLKNEEFNLSISFLLFIMAVILAPIYEEIIFRSLLKFEKINIILFIITTPILIVVTAIHVIVSAVILLSILLLSVISLLLIYKRNKIELFLSSNFKYFFYGVALTFGLTHTSNFAGNFYLILLFSPLLVGPQIVLGLILGYVRMKHGLVYSIIFHMLVNFVFMISLLK